jgi:LAGLIDADG-like domain
VPGEGGEVVNQLRPTSVTTLEKFGYMLETPPYPWLLDDSSDNAWGDADNQQGSRPVESTGLTPQRLHAELLAVSPPIACAYLHGALHDATKSSLHGTVRFGQRQTEWLDTLGFLLRVLGYRSWTYREGQNRDFWVLEASSKWIMSRPRLDLIEEQVAYARGYFDAEGWHPKKTPNARFYIQLVQKNFEDLRHLRELLEGLGVRCGRLHNLSATVDPDMWRFYVLVGSHRTFAEMVSSWHPRKRSDLEAWLAKRRARMKI